MKLSEHIDKVMTRIRIRDKCEKYMSIKIEIRSLRLQEREIERERLRYKEKIFKDYTCVGHRLTVIR